MFLLPDVTFTGDGHILYITNASCCSVRLFGYYLLVCLNVLRDLAASHFPGLLEVWHIFIFVLGHTQCTVCSLWYSTVCTLSLRASYMLLLCADYLRALIAFWIVSGRKFPAVPCNALILGIASVLI